MRKVLVIGMAAMAAALVMGGAGCAGEGAQAAGSVSPSASESSSASPSLSESGSPSASLSASASTRSSTKLNADDARRIAQTAVPAGTITEVDLLDGNSWKIHLTAPDGRYEVIVNASTGTVIKVERSGGGGPTTSGTPGPRVSDDHGGDRNGSDDN
jgi:hypothetical protein